MVTRTHPPTVRLEGFTLAEDARVSMSYRQSDGKLQVDFLSMDELARRIDGQLEL